MYGVAWVAFTAGLVVVGLVIAFALTAWAPIFALIALVVAAAIGFAYLGGKRVQIGTERERIDRGDLRSTRGGPDGAPAQGEGSARGSADDERYEPVL